MSRANMITTTLRSDAGFGSNFLQTVDWFWYSKNTGVPIYVNWNENGKNFFDDLYIQKVDGSQSYLNTDAYYAWSSFSEQEVDEIRFKEMPLYKKYNRCLVGTSGVYNEPDFKRAMEILHKAYKDCVSVQPSILDIIPELDNTLAVHIRMIGLYFADIERKVPLHTIMTEDEFYKKNLAQLKQKFESGGYEQIYLGCDDKKFFDICVSEFGDKLIFQNYVRNSYHNSINRYVAHAPNTGLNERPPVAEEFYNALVDILILASCKDFLGCVSSFTFSVLVVNPYSNFSLFETSNCGYTG